MEDHLKNKDRLEQEWQGLCAYEAEPCETTVAQKVSSVWRCGGARWGEVDDGVVARALVLRLRRCFVFPYF